MTGAEFLVRERELQLDAERTGTEQVWVSQVSERVVMLGKSGNMAEEVQPDCAVPVLRRDSGGGAVVLGPHCLIYSLVFDLEKRTFLREVDKSYVWILDRVMAALSLPGLRRQESDIVLGDRKCAGCSQRRMRRTVLHHGVILTALFDVSRFLREPVRRPAYRGLRTHAEFLTAIAVPPDFPIRLQEAFQA